MYLCMCDIYVCVTFTYLTNSVRYTLYIQHTHIHTYIHTHTHASTHTWSSISNSPLLLPLRPFSTGAPSASLPEERLFSYFPEADSCSVLLSCTVAYLFPCSCGLDFCVFSVSEACPTCWFPSCCGNLNATRLPSRESKTV